MITTVQTNMLNLPTDLQYEIMNLLSTKDLVRFSAVCRQLRSAASEKIAQISINQLSQYTNKRCDWCDKAIVVIRTRDSQQQVNSYKIAQFVFSLGTAPCHSDFSPILKEFKCDEKLELPSQGPCVCEID